VVRAFEQLAPIDQRILALRVVDGCTSDEVALQTGLSSMAVRTRLHRAREKVRHACGELSA
jgi:RNA polymerase sigma factor (sigma-70 family)